MTRGQHGFIHAPRDRLPITADDSAQFPMVPLASFCLSRWAFDVLLQTDLFITRLRCAGPDISESMARHSVGACQTAVLREPFTIFRTRVRSTLSVRLEVNLHDVLSLSSISIDVLDLFP